MCLPASQLTGAICILEAAVGIGQAIYGYWINAGSFDLAAGDVVKGTIGLAPLPDGTGSNQMYAILQSSMLALLVAMRAELARRPIVLPVVVVAVSWLFASVMHTILLWLVALILSGVIAPRVYPKRRSLRRVVRVVSVPIFVVGFVLLFMPANLTRVLPTVVGLSLLGKGAAPASKLIAAKNTAEFVPMIAPYQPYIGIGPGQYSSRAGLILSGEYLGRSIPVSGYAGEALDENILGLWRRFKQSNITGSTFFPFFSWLSIYGELGMLGVVAIGVAGFALIRRMRACARRAHPLATGLTFLTIYVLLLGFQDNYWEFSQVMLPILLVGKICHQYLRGVCAPGSAQRVT